MIDTAHGYEITLDDADVFLERLTQEVWTRTHEEAPPRAGDPLRVAIEIHHPDGRLIVGVVSWDAERECWASEEDELAEVTWECMARIGAI